MPEPLHFPRESKELVAVTVTESGASVTAFELTLTPAGARPTSGWAAATVVGTSRGYLLPGTLDDGNYTLWARVTDDPEAVVIEVARIELD